MNIRKIKDIPQNESLIVIGKGEKDFSTYLTGLPEKKHLKEQTSRGNKLIIINLFDRHVFFQIVDDVNPVSLEDMRKSGYKINCEIKEFEIKQISIIHAAGSPEMVMALAEGLALSSYRFSKYFTGKDKKKKSLKDLGIFSEEIENSRIKELSNLVKAVYYTRDLVNEPVSWLNAVKLSEEIARLGEEAGFNVEVLNKKKIESLKMGGLLAVNKGSIDPPTFSILEYKPKGHVNAKPVVLVGKGIVYDTGGLSLKPTPDSMDYMKCDMAGGAAVAGAFYAIAKSELPYYIIGLIPATDNRPDGNAYVPGDVITMHNGSTVEVLNTDAEGRLILADALSYAKQYDPQLVIELSTLTGAAQAALGNLGMAGMGNAERKTMDMLIEAGFTSFERIAELPFWDDYLEMMKSDIADLKNIGGKVAGAITAGKFLEQFTDYPYIHLDIAGVAFSKKNENYRGKGGSGVGVRLLFEFLKTYLKQNTK
jgi:leucyl aminopeptidase